MTNKNVPGEDNTSLGVDVDTFDRAIVPAETAARKEREGSAYKETPRETGQQDPESIKTTDGYTVDKEGLLDNFAIEPEMYVNEPGDLRQHEEELATERAQEMEDVNEDKQGQLTMEQDKRGKGQGIL